MYVLILSQECLERQVLSLSLSAYKPLSTLLLLNVWITVMQSAFASQTTISIVFRLFRIQLPETSLISQCFATSPLIRMVCTGFLSQREHNLRISVLCIQISTILDSATSGGNLRMFLLFSLPYKLWCLTSMHLILVAVHSPS